MFFEKLPTEILLDILEKADLPSNAAMAKTSTKWRNLASDESLWKMRVNTELTRHSLKQGQTYKEFYIQFYKQKGVYVSCDYQNYLRLIASFTPIAQYSEKNLPSHQPTLEGFLAQACQYGAEVWAEKLLKQGADADFYLNHEFEEALGIKAIQVGNADLLQLLIIYDHDLNYKRMGKKNVTKKNMSLFHAALFSDQPDVYFKILLSNSRKVTILPELHQAIIKRDYSAMVELIKCGADVNEYDKTNCRPLWWALMRDFHDGFELLIKSGAFVNEIYVEEDGEKISALNVIINENKKGFLNLILANKIKCEVDESWIENFETGEGTTLLQRAVQNSMGEEVRLLLKHNASGIESALHTAVSKGNLEILKIIVEAGAKINEKITWMHNSARELVHHTLAPLVTAAKYGHVDCVKFLLEKNADPGISVDETSVRMSKPHKKKIIKNITSLHCIAKYITGIEQGLKLNIVGEADEEFKQRQKKIDQEFFKFDYDPLDEENEISYNAIRILKLLLEFGAPVNAMNSAQDSAMSILISGLLTPSNVMHQNINKLIYAAVEMLLQYDAQLDVDAKYWEDKNTLIIEPLSHCIIYHSYLELLQLVVHKEKSIIHIKDELGNTALLAAAKKGDLETIKYLISEEANIADENDYGETLLSIAENNDYQHIIDYFQSETPTP